MRKRKIGGRMYTVRRSFYSKFDATGRAAWLRWEKKYKSVRVVRSLDNKKWDVCTIP